MKISLQLFKKTFLLQPEWVLAAGITLLAVWLNVFFLVHAGGFWRDEVNLINLAGSHSLREMAKDSFPVLMPLAVHGWSKLGLAQNDLDLRLLGSLIGLGIVAALWVASWTTRRLPPLVGLELLALNSTVIASGNSIRAHGLGSLLIVLAAAAAWALVKKPSWLRAGIFAAAAIASVQTLFQNTILIAAICAGIFAVCGWRKNRRAAVQAFVAGTVAAVSLLPYLPALVSAQVSGNVWRTGFQLMPALNNLTIAIGFPYGQYRYVWGADLVKLQMQQTNTIQPVLEKIAATLKAGHHVWIIAGVGWMSVPVAGEPPPASLLLPPLPSSGWADMPYTFIWTSQITHFLGDHSFKFGRVNNSAVGAHILENTELFSASGWINSSIASPQVKTP